MFKNMTLIVIVISEILSLLFPIKSPNKMIIDSMGIGNKITINDKFVDNSDFASLTIENLSMTIQATPIKVVINSIPLVHEFSERMYLNGRSD